ncbi:glycosyl hydrolase [Agromyces sp. NPDC056965]|uniref:glycosyl hydrolase n=1 Tax=Agromyces sp. NPDC056965 TaxID=3345983 RepID=UPI003625664A
MSFGSTAESSGATVRIGDSTAAPTVRSYADRECWELGGGIHNFIYIKLDDALKHTGANAASIDIGYFDSAPGKFTISYDAISGAGKQTTVIETTGTNTWKSAHFFVADGGFTGRQQGGDLRIATWAPAMGGSAGPVCIGDLTLAPSPIATDDVQLAVTTDANVFDSGDAPSFGVLSARSDEIAWSIRDYDGAVVRTGTASVDPASRQGTIGTEPLPDGYYTIAATGQGPTGDELTRTAGFAIMKPPADPTAQAESMFGINAHTIKAGESFDWSDATEAASRAGAGNVRIDTVYWNSVEATKGTYTFSPGSEQIAEQLAAQGQRGLYILGYGHPLYGGTPSTEEAYEAYGNYSAAVAEHFRDTIGAVEVWNEYYGGFSKGVCSQSAKCYAAMLAATYDKVKAVAPDVTVVGASSFKVPLDWYEEFFALGGLEHLDVISIHPYRAPGTPDGLALDVAGLQELIKKYNHGESKPIWITEQGWAVGTASAIAVNEQTQAQSLSRSLLEAKAAGIAKYFWYDLINDGTQADHSEQNFGMLRRTSADATSINPKPSYVAYATTSRELTGADYVGTVKSKDPAARGYRFAGTDGAITALWSADRTPKPVTIKAEEPITAVDLMGAETVLEPIGGRLHLTLTDEPVFLRADVDTIKAGAAITITAPETTVAGEDVAVTVRFDPSGRQRDAAVEIEGRTIEVTAANGRPSETVVSIPAGTVGGTRTVRATATFDGHAAGLATATTEVVPETVTIDVAPTIAGGFDTKLALTLSNHSNAAPASVDGIEWTYGDATGTLGAQPLLAPGETRVVEVPLTGQQPYLIRDAAVTAAVGGDRTITDTDAFAFAPVSRATPKLKHGQLSGLDDVPAIDLAAVGNFQKIDAATADGDVWTTWDKRHLYVSAVVHEEQYQPAKRAEWLPAGDSIAIGLQPGRPGGGLGSWGADWYMLYAGQSLEGNGVYVESLPRQYNVDMMADAEVEVVRDEDAKTTTYLIAIPWEQIQPLSPEEPEFSLTVAINKRDQVDRDNYRSLGLLGWQQWGNGVNNWKLAQYQQVRLTR